MLMDPVPEKGMIFSKIGGNIAGAVEGILLSESSSD